MSDQSGAGHLERQEIIIVRRRASTEEAHHGGVWKIAFADFMTAMMAFFLVMWLTNASDMATRRQVAQYFNPIKLNDAAPATRGVESKDDGASRQSNEQGQSRVETNGDPHGKPLAGDQLGGEEQALFRDPYAVLAEIAAESVSTSSDKLQGKPDGSGLPGLNGGDAYRDPFDPASWQLSPNTVEGGKPSEVAPPSEFQTAVLPPENSAASETAAEEMTPVADGAAAAETADDSSMPDLDVAALDGQAAPGEQADPVDVVDAASEQATAVRSEIEAELAKSGQSLPPNVEVTAGDGGVRISLADDLATGMFQIGSARPTPEAVAMMEKVAAVLARRVGDVVIRGHTDARPFHSAEYDNWRLSTARAHMAYYMLTRGGFEETRVKSIEGLADRDPKFPDDPKAAGNRRIEILLIEPVT
ncbi:MotB family protein [Aurantimonas marina]|uniref:MotB family protein n=1 Tax=Aurantimonas marina TaxID=2780508 RepID=UPI0019D102BE